MNIAEIKTELRAERLFLMQTRQTKRQSFAYICTLLTAIDALESIIELSSDSGAVTTAQRTLNDIENQWNQ